MSGRTVRLADVTVRIGSGITPRGGSNVYKATGRPFVRSQNIGWGELRLDDLAYIDDATHALFSATELRREDVLLNITGASIGRSAVASPELVGGNVNQHVCEIRLKRDVMDPYFVNAFLLSRAGQDQIDKFQAGGNRQGLNFQQVGSIEIPHVDIQEQRAIGVVHRDSDSMIAALDRIIAKKRAIKQGTMQQLLARRTRLPGFTDPWRSDSSLQDVCDRVTGYWGADAATSIASVAVRVIRAGDIAPEGKLLDSARRHFSPTEYKRAACREGDVVITASGNGLGKTYYVRSADQLAASNFVRILRPRVDVCGEFIAYLLQSETARAMLNTHTATSAYPNLMPSFFSAPWFELPGRPEQVAIAETLRSIDDEIDALTSRRRKAWAIKQGMLQELLSGRARLVSKVAA